MSRFHSKWEAEVVKEEILASGKWYYQNELPYDAELIRQQWNYCSRDLPELDELLEIPYCDYINFGISDEGATYHWRFSGPMGETTSPTFPTYFQARDHINTYGYKYDISW